MCESGFCKIKSFAWEGSLNFYSSPSVWQTQGGSVLSQVLLLNWFCPFKHFVRALSHKDMWDKAKKLYDAFHLVCGVKVWTESKPVRESSFQLEDMKVSGTFLFFLLSLSFSLLKQSAANIIVHGSWDSQQTDRQAGNLSRVRGDIGDSIY